MGDIFMHAKTIGLALAAAASWPMAPPRGGRRKLQDHPDVRSGWTDISSTNAIATEILGALGYKTDIKTLSVLVGYQAMQNKDNDVFLGNWMPAQQKFIDDLNAAKAVEVVTKNLEGAKFTLAVPSYVAEKGIKDFKDLELPMPTPSARKFTASSRERLPTRNNQKMSTPATST